MDRGSISGWLPAPGIGHETGGQRWCRRDTFCLGVTRPGPITCCGNLGQVPLVEVQGVRRQDPDRAAPRNMSREGSPYPLPPVSRHATLRSCSIASPSWEPHTPAAVITPRYCGARSTPRSTRTPGSKNAANVGYWYDAAVARLLFPSAKQTSWRLGPNSASCQQRTNVERCARTKRNYHSGNPALRRQSSR